MAASTRTGWPKPLCAVPTRYRDFAARQDLYGDALLCFEQELKRSGLMIAARLNLGVDAALICTARRAAQLNRMPGSLKISSHSTTMTTIKRFGADIEVI